MEKVGEGKKTKIPPVIWQILRLLHMGAGKSLGSKLTEQLFFPSQKSNSPWRYSASVYICYQVSFICSLNNKIHAGEGEEGRQCILIYHIKQGQPNSCTIPTLIHTGKKEEKEGETPEREKKKRLFILLKNPREGPLMQRPCFYKCFPFLTRFL